MRSILSKILGLLILASVSFSDNSSQNDDIQLISKIILDCVSKQDITICFKMKAFRVMDRLIKAPSSVPLNDFMTLVRTDSPMSNDSSVHTVLTEEELEASLPRQLEEKSNKLDHLLWSKFKTLLATRTLQIHAPFEGRGKDKGLKGKGAMIMMMGGMMMKMMMAGVGMMSMKAMMMAKAALVLSVIIAIKKLGGSSGGDSHPQVVYAPAPAPVVAEHTVHSSPTASAGGGYYKRRHSDPHNLAYGTSLDFK